MDFLDYQHLHFFCFLILLLLSMLGRMLKFLPDLSPKSSSSPISSPLTWSMPLVFVLVFVYPLFFSFYVTISIDIKGILVIKKSKNLHSAKFEKISLTFWPDLALALKCKSCNYLAYPSASSNFIYLLDSRSLLLPTIIMGNSLPNYCRNSFTHIDIF